MSAYNTGIVFANKSKFGNFGTIGISTAATTPSKMLNQGLPTLGMNGVMNEALNKYKQADHEQVMLKARIVKLYKEEEEANKRIGNARRKAKFINEMN